MKQELLMLIYKEKNTTDLNHNTSRKRFYLRWQAFMSSTLSPEKIEAFDSSFSYHKDLQILYDKEDAS